MNRNPVAGDVIQIGKKRVEHLVVDDGLAVEGNNYAGCTYTWFNAVPATKVDPITGLIDGLKVKKYYTQVSGASYPVTPLEEIRLLAKAKFKKQTSYQISKVRSV